MHSVGSGLVKDLHTHLAFLLNSKAIRNAKSHLDAMSRKPQNAQQQTTDPKSLMTEDEVKQVLQADKGEDAELISFEIVDFTKPGDNYSNFVTSVEVKYSLEGEEQEVVYVAKVNSCKPLEGYEEISHEFFDREVKFYTDLAPELNAVLEEAGKEPLKIPKFYHANCELGKEQAYYEDLRAQDFKMVDRVQSLDVAHTNLVLQEIAKFHAASRLLQEKCGEELSKKHDCLGKNWGSYADNPLMTGIVHGHIDHATKILKKAGGDEKSVKWLDGLKSRAFEILADIASNDTFAALNHGTLWSNNLLFRYNDDGEPEEVMLLDFESATCATVASDLNFLMYTSLSDETRKENLQDFLSTYTTAYQEVLEAGGLDKSFSEEELMEEFREHNEHGALCAVLTIPTVLLESGDLPDIANMEGDDLDEILEEFWSGLHANISSNTLKPRFLAMFEEFMETHSDWFEE